MKRYEPKNIEPKWQKTWAETRLYEVTEDKARPKIYASPMLPYPSGTGLHTGHVRNYSIADAVARFYRQKGFNTMSNIAWDAFGLPAENFAIKTGTPPAESTAKNIAYFKEQLLRLGMSFAWEREFNTSDPSYYRWTQWVFSILYQRGLAYQAEKSQWWCESCKTVLADEQVVAGKCWRHDGDTDPLVKKKSLKQWFFKITDYADRILEATDDLEWPEKIKTMQKNWIGKSKGAEVKFKVDGSTEVITVFTTRPDTLFGATFLVLAPEHELVNKITTADKKAGVEAYQGEASKKDDIERQASKDKTGVFTGVYAVNPINGEKIPVWIADYVLSGYGTGAIMAVPAHDERDNAFAKKFNLPLVEVVSRHELPDGKEAFKEETLHRDVVDCIIKDNKSGEYLLIEEPGGATHFVGGGIEEGDDELTTVKKETVEEVGYTSILSIKKVSSLASCLAFRLTKQKNQATKGYAYEVVVDRTIKVDSEAEEGRHKILWVTKEEVESRITWGGHLFFWKQYLSGDTIFSGEGIVQNSGEYSGMSTSEVREKIVIALAAKGVGAEKTTYKIRDWLISRQRYWGAPIPIIHCSDHGAVLVPDNQLPVVLPYVENYAPDGSNHSVLAGVEEWVNAPCPTCGRPSKRETDTMDGYVCSTWYTHRYTDAHNDKMAFDSEKANYWFPMDFYFGADHAVAHLLYIRFFNYVLADMGIMKSENIEPIKKLVFNGYINAEDGSKMSKSKGNTVDPMDIINSGYGADALRVFELFIAPYEQDTSWNTKGVPGTYRFLQRVWNLTQEYVDAEVDAQDNSATDSDVYVISHKTVKKVTEDLNHLSFNTAVAAMMTMTNELFLIKVRNPIVKNDAWKYALESLVQLLAPFAPHMSEELWHDLGHNDSVHIDHWPEWDDAYLTSDTVVVVAMINGKVRAQMTVDKDVSEQQIVELALSQDKIKAHLSGEPKKTIFVKNKLVNFVI
jgi:leucyl-tRNA synthetase